MKKQTKNALVVMALLLTGLALVWLLMFNAMVEDCRARYIAGEDLSGANYCAGHIPEQQA